MHQLDLRDVEHQLIQSLRPSWVPIAVVCVFAIAPPLLYRIFMTQHTAIGWARRCAKVNNLTYAVVCLLASAAMLWKFGVEAHVSPLVSIWHGCRAPQYASEVSDSELQRLGLLFFLSKIWEFQDIVYVLFMGVPLDLHFRFHHTTTPLLAWLGGIPVPIAQSLLPLMFANVFHHVFMYAYVRGVAAARLILMVTGTIQLVVGLYVSVGSLAIRRGWLGFSGGTECGGRELTEVAGTTLYLCYFALWLREMHEKGICDSIRRKKKQEVRDATRTDKTKAD